MALKMSMSILAREKELFTPLPKEQQLTEESLIKLEQQVIRRARQTEAMLAKSEKIANESVGFLD